MRILLTGAGSNLGKGLIPKLIAAGHDLVLSDLDKLPQVEVFEELPFHQVDVQQGFGLEKAAEGCDLILHTPAWHGMHWNQKTEADFWRLNVDGTFWAFQAARANGIRRFLFLSSQSWHGHYDKYGFTKRIGEELCAYHRQANGISYISVRPHDFTPWGSDWVNRYGARLLYGGVDREDVLDCVIGGVNYLSDGLDCGLVVDATRKNSFKETQISNWDADPIGSCERLFPGSAEMIEKYGIDVSRKPGIVTETGWNELRFHPRVHFGTFIQELIELDRALGPEAVRGKRCDY